MKGDENPTDCSVSQHLHPEQGQTGHCCSRGPAKRMTVTGHLQERVRHLARPKGKEHMGQILIKGVEDGVQAWRVHQVPHTQVPRYTVTSCSVSLLGKF